MAARIAIVGHCSLVHIKESQGICVIDALGNKLKVKQFSVFLSFLIPTLHCSIPVVDILEVDRKPLPIWKYRNLERLSHRRVILLKPGGGIVSSCNCDIPCSIVAPLNWNSSS